AEKNHKRSRRMYFTLPRSAAGTSRWLWETRGSRLPLRRVFRLWIGIGSLGNLDGPRRRRPTGCGRQIFTAGIAVIRQKRGYYAQGFDLRFHLRQLDFFQPENFVSILHAQLQ